MNFQNLFKQLLSGSSSESSFSSAAYWEKRYAQGDNSGAGSYDNLAEFKAKILNKFVKEHGIKKVIELGVGDGNQLLHAQYPEYIGYDVSGTAVRMCEDLFKGDTTKKFYTLDNLRDQKAELTLSLDVLYHLVEQDIFEKHLQELFGASTKYVIIYAANADEYQTAQHVKSRNFTHYIRENMHGWVLDKQIPNEHPYDPNNPQHTTWADFFIYKRVEE